MRSLKLLCQMGAAALLLVMCASRAGADCDPAPAGLIGWWPADGAANDVGGNYNGSWQGGLTNYVTGVVGSAFSFDGTNSYIKTLNSTTVKPTNLTVEAWVNFTSLDSQSSNPGHQYIVFKQNSRGNQSNFEGFGLGKDRYPNVPNTNGDILYFNASSSSGVIAEVDSVTTVVTGVWYHVAGVRGTNYLQLYVNGRLEAQTNISFPQNYSNTNLVYFGTTGQPAFFDGKLNGLLDEVSIYNRALSSNEIAAIYQAGSAGKCKVPPVITNQSGSLAVVVSNSAAFSVGVSGNLFNSYHWQFNGKEITNAKTNTYTLTHALTTNAGNYSVVITNTYGAVTSTPAGLTVLNDSNNLPPGATISVNSGFANLTIGGGTTGLTYGIQFSTNLTDWLGLTNLTLAMPGQSWTNSRQTTLQAEYYRLINGAIPLP